MALLTIRSGVNNHPEKTVLQLASDLIRKGGIIKGFECTEKAGGVNMSIDIHPVSISTPATMYVKKETAYPISLNTIENISIALNTNPEPLIGVIIIYVDLTQVPNPSGEGTGIAKFMYIAGAPASTPVAPNKEEIEAIIGSSTPYEILYEVKVNSQVTAITNEDLTDVRQRAYVKTSKRIISISKSGTVCPNADDADQFNITMAGNITLQNPTEMMVGDWLTIQLKQDSTGNRTCSFSNFKIMGPDLSLNLNPNKITEFAIKRDLSGYFLYPAGKEY